MFQTHTEYEQNALKESAALWLTKLQERLERLESVSLDALMPEDTALVVVDMINGFAREGLLSSPRVGALIPGISELSDACLKKGIPVIAPSDAHLPNSQEFCAYPVHCVENSAESALVDELIQQDGILRLPKNSTQTWHSEAFQSWFKENKHRRNWILTGDCTDICVLQFALALKTSFQSANQSSRILVPVNLVDTFETPDHPGDLYHLIGLDLMAGGGIELVKRIETP